MWIPGNDRFPPPEEYIDLQLCRIYTCTPSELDEQDAERVATHAFMIGLEQEVAALKRKARKR